MRRIVLPHLIHSRQRLILVGCELLSSILRVEFALFGRNLSRYAVVDGTDERGVAYQLKLDIPIEFQNKKEGYQEHVFFDVLGVTHDRRDSREHANH